MAHALPIPPHGFDELSAEEKVRYVAALWDRIVENEGQLPISEAQRAVLRERLAVHRADPHAVRPWSEVRAEIEQSLSKRRAR